MKSKKDEVRLLSEDEKDSDEDVEENSDDSDTDVSTEVHRSKKALKTKAFARRLCKLCITFKEGWKIYIRQDIALVGFSMASIYLTVLGFSGVTSAYFLTQGLRQDLIGLFQGVGAIFGVVGTIIYPFLRKRVGTVRSGLFGISTQLMVLSLCVVGVFLPSNRMTSSSDHYYAPECPVQMIGTPKIRPNSTTLPALLPSSIQPTPCVTGTIAAATTAHHSMVHGLVPTPFPCENSSFDTDFEDPPASGFVPNSVTMATPTEDTSTIGLYVLIVGVVVCRIGLWMYDLAVQQLVQENVIEEERGVVSGVMNAMNSVNDMLHYGLVIVAPRPENFNILTVISFLMVALGWVLYALYVRKSRGHFTHFRDCGKKIKSMNYKAC